MYAFKDTKACEVDAHKDIIRIGYRSRHDGAALIMIVEISMHEIELQFIDKIT